MKNCLAELLLDSAEDQLWELYQMHPYYGLILSVQVNRREI
jgi:hypothetical protein